MTAEILIPVALAALLLVVVLSLLLRRRPKRSARLVSASLESVSPATVDKKIAPSSSDAQAEAPPQKQPQARKAVPSSTVAKISETVASKPTKVAQPAPLEEDRFLPTLKPTPVAATSARSSVPAQSPEPNFVVQSTLKSGAPSRKAKTAATPPSEKSIAEPTVDLTPASDKVVDITTAISVRAPQKPKISRSALPEEIRAALAKLNQRIDRLEDAVLDLENQLGDFDLDFTQPVKAAETVSSSPAENKVEAEVKSEVKSETDAVKSDRDEKTIAA